MNLRTSIIFGLKLIVSALVVTPSVNAQPTGADLSLRGHGSSVVANVRDGAHLRAEILGDAHNLRMSATGRMTRGYVFAGPCGHPQLPRTLTFPDNGRLGIHVVPCY